MMLLHILLGITVILLISVKEETTIKDGSRLTTVYESGYMYNMYEHAYMHYIYSMVALTIHTAK